METLNSFSVELDLQNPNNIKSLPAVKEMQTWCKAAIQTGSTQRAFKDRLSVLIRVVDSDESADLNKNYREKIGPTNVLSFPANLAELMPDTSDLSKEQREEINEHNSHLGDLVICEPLVNKEAAEQSKLVVSHWAHLIIHGVLHLQGFDHIDDTDAVEMESLEIDILEKLGFLDPYKSNN